MASRGVSVVYELGTEAQRKELLGSLMGTLSGEKPKRRRVKLADDTAVFSEGAVRVDDEALKKKDEGGGGRFRRVAEHVQGAVLDRDRHRPARFDLQVHGPRQLPGDAEQQQGRGVRVCVHRQARRRRAGAASRQAPAEALPHAARPEPEDAGGGQGHLGCCGG
jgi:hypothetical protein